MTNTAARQVVGFAMLVVVAHVAAQVRSASSFDVYGYRAYDSTEAQCGYGYVDASSGSPLTLTAASGGAPAKDDGSATLALVTPFELYGISGISLAASSNGYLAVPADASSEDGGDFSADCPLPAIADNTVASQARIYVYHADLDGAPNAGDMYAQYYASCPRMSESGVAEACTVVQWKNWSVRGQSGTLNTEAVLYHTTFEIALQYQSLDASAGNTATIGTQSNNAQSGNAYGCGGNRTLVPASAVCLFDPRFPPGSRGVRDSIFASSFE